MQTPPHTIIFDIGNVLIGWDPRNLYRQVFAYPDQADWFVQNIVTLDWNEEQDKGRPVAEATELLVAQHPKWEKEIRLYYDRWTEHFSGPITGTVEILKRLHGQQSEGEAAMRLLALTNWSAELFPWARENHDFLALFEDICVSGEVRMKKPEPRIYEHIRERWDLGDFGGCLFIDDSPRNVVAARRLGLDSIRFSHPGQLIASLRARGISI